MTSDDDDNDEAEILSLLGMEEEVPLSAENRDLMTKMLQHYKIDDEVIRKILEEPTDVEESDTSFLYSSEERIASWKKTCGEDGNCLEDYFQLFLEQSLELSRRVTRDFLAMI